MKIHQVLKRTGPEASRGPHQSVAPAPHQNHPAAVGDVPGSTDSRYPAHESSAPAVS
ncbi:hypothetical protein A2U01_0091282 [Trifolium medium]|uniref:Uncharacterized protein n=1 Tax=Trifolium medium TaxID=97028 RepID=A0A392U928_9FABA|nr:hypothetical protein [Trifolium medium]